MANVEPAIHRVFITIGARSPALKPKRQPASIAARHRKESAISRIAVIVPRSIGERVRLCGVMECRSSRPTGSGIAIKE
jgi:hypothetical protein